MEEGIVRSGPRFRTPASRIPQKRSPNWPKTRRPTAGDPTKA